MFGATATTRTTSTTSSGATTSTASSEDKEMFLQLLVAQMRYQDPSNPTDTSQFLSQTAQFTALEKMQDVADQTAQLVNVQMAFGATAMVGRTVVFPAGDGSQLSGVVSGVTFGADGPMLQVNGASVPMASVQGVGDGSADVTAALDTADSSDTADTV
jgi:flagellar basal-body rod modification protein FlgD